MRSKAPLALAAIVCALPVTACARSSPPPAAVSPAPVPSAAHDDLRSGDLVFLDLDCGSLCDAMATVTEQQFGVSGPGLSHVAIVERAGDQLSVLEAWPAHGVARTPLAQVLARKQRTPARFIHLRESYRATGDAVVAAAAKRIGTPYDDDFLPNNGKLYCSELIDEAFRDALGDKSPFHTSPMTFGTAGSPARDVWNKYYGDLHEPVPDGAAGISPLGVYLEARPLTDSTP